MSNQYAYPDFSSTLAFGKAGGIENSLEPTSFLPRPLCNDLNYSPPRTKRVCGKGYKAPILQAKASTYRHAMHMCVFVAFTLVSGASHGIVVTPPTKLAGVDCEPKFDLDSDASAAQRLGLYTASWLEHLWVSDCTLIRL